MSATMVKLDGKTGVAPADMSPKPVFWDGLNLLIGFSGRKFSRQELFIQKECRVPAWSSRWRFVNAWALQSNSCRAKNCKVFLAGNGFSLPGPIWRCRLIFLPRHATFSCRLPSVNWVSPMAHLIRSDCFQQSFLLAIGREAIGTEVAYHGRWLSA